MSVGEDLTQARLRSGLSVAEVSQRTRIRETIIRGIEQDDFTQCGGDFYAKGHIRAIAQVVGADAVPLIGEFDATRTAHHDITAAEAFQPVLPVRVRERPRHPNRVLLVAVVLLVIIGAGGYYLLSSSGASPGQLAGSSGGSPAGSGHARHHTGPSPAPSASHSSSSPAAGPVASPLAPVSAVAFGPGGPAHGDNPPQARLAIDARPGTAWHTDWYYTAAFGGLQPGTGLLLDMGHPVRVTKARIVIGGTGSALQVRVGNAPSLAALRRVASAGGAGGVVRLRVARPARGRYVLIWFTRLPLDPAGTYEGSVSSIALRGSG